MFDSRTERLLTLLPWLTARRSTVLSEIATKFQLTESKLINDLTTLTFTGPGQYGGDLVDIHFNDGVVSIINSQGFDKPSRLSSDEARLLAKTLINLLPYLDQSMKDVASNLINKLMKNEEVVHVVESENNESSSLDLIVDAIKSKRILGFEYSTEREQKSRERSVLPNYLEWRRGELYLDGICQEQLAERTFKVDRIQKLRVLPTDNLVAETPAKDNLHQDKDIYKIQMVIDTRLSNHLEEYPDFKLVDQRGDYSEISFSVFNENHAVSLVLKYYNSISSVTPNSILDKANGFIRTIVGER